MDQKVVLLWSGGIDSTLCLYRLFQDPTVSFIYPFFVNYGHRGYLAEKRALGKILEHLRSEYGRVHVAKKVSGIHTSEFPLAAHLLTDGPGQEYKEGFATDLVPGRNSIFALLAYYRARQVGANRVTTGFHVFLETHTLTYPDCRSEWPLYMQHLFDLENLSCTVDSPPVTLYLPIQDLGKDAIVTEAKRIGVPCHLTWSCLFPVESYKACGECTCCLDRIEIGLEP